MLYNNIIFRDVGNTELFPHHNKNIPPEVASAGISALGSLVGGLFGSSSSKYAAKAQLQAVRETNKANLDLAKYQNDWNVAQWNRQNPSSQNPTLATPYRAHPKEVYYLEKP